MIFSIKKQRGLKRNGVLNRYITITRNGWPTFISKLFKEYNWCYLTIIFEGKDIKIQTILWKDEAELLKSTIVFPFKYRIYAISSNGHHLCLEIILKSIPEAIKDAYKTMNSDEFCEYYKLALKGY